jgi:hypothetical protein
MQHEQANGTWVVWRTALERRAQARREAMSVEEFGAIETEKYDLDTAGITGEDNPRTYQVEPWGDEKGPIDYREDNPLID